MRRNDVVCLYLGIILFFLMDILYYIKPLSRLDIALLLDVREKLSAFHLLFFWIAKYMNLYILTIVVVGILFFMRKRTIAYWLLGNTVIVGLCFNYLLKNMFHRVRPTIVPQLIQERSFSFPSGSVLVSTLLFGGLCLIASQLIKKRSYCWMFQTLMVVLILLVSLSRIYVGVHYPTDVLAAICLGFSALLISKYFLEREK